MNTAFPRILTLLRKERGISQKKAATDLGVSQALLSHYEKGIRECGWILWSVPPITTMYPVIICWGRTPDKTGAVIAINEIPDNDPSAKDNQYRGSVLPVLNKKLIVNSLNILFDLLQHCGSKGLTTEISAYLTLSVYAVFRELYASNPKNPAAMFSVDGYIYPAALLGEQGKTLARIGRLAQGHNIGEVQGLDAQRIPSILPDDLTRQYPLFASSLFNLLRNAESCLK